MPKINLGDKAKDSITGFSGVVVARTEWLNGCIRTTLQPQGLRKDGGVLVSETFDDTQLVLVKAGVITSGGQRLREPAAAHSGGPRPAPASLPGPIAR